MFDQAAARLAPTLSEGEGTCTAKFVNYSPLAQPCSSDYEKNGFWTPDNASVIISFSASRELMISFSASRERSICGRDSTPELKADMMNFGEYHRSAIRDSNAQQGKTLQSQSLRQQEYKRYRNANCTCNLLLLGIVKMPGRYCASPSYKQFPSRLKWGCSKSYLLQF